jgi:enoyl-CoA hydratase/carnithine racemase
VRYWVENGVATVTLDRPKAYNCYSTLALEELALAFRDAAWDDEVAVVVYTGAGDRAFCTGGDVKEYERDYVARPRDKRHNMGLFRSYIESILRCPKPVIARINGIAVGGGNESQLACDFAVAGSHVWLGQVGTGVGSVACGGSTQWLPLAVGDRRARRMLFLNERVYAEQALDWGLVSEVAPTGATARSGSRPRAQATSSAPTAASRAGRSNWHRSTARGAIGGSPQGDFPGMPALHQGADQLLKEQA